MNTTTEDLQLHASDDVLTQARVIRAASERSVVVIAGATAVPAASYERFARHLAEHGHSVLTFDYRGVGRSRPTELRGFDADMTGWGRDLEAALQWALATDLPMSIVGHSFGGQALGLAPSAAHAQRVLTVGSQLGWVGHWPTAYERWRFGLLMRFAVPSLTGVYGYLPGWAGTVEDLPSGVARQWARWCLSPGYLLDHVPDAAATFATVHAPTTVLAITDDPLAPTAAVEAFAALLPDATIRTVSPADAGTDRIGHFGFFRPACRSLWDQAAATLAT